MHEKASSTRRRAPIRVSIIAQHHLVRLGLASVFSDVPGFVVVGHAETESGVRAAPDDPPADVFLLNGEAGAAWVEACRRVRALNPEAGIIVLMSDSNCALMVQAIDAGANACCLRDISPDRLMSAIVGVSQGDIWVDSQVAWQLIDEFGLSQQTRLASPLEKAEAGGASIQSGSIDDSIYLTGRESEVLKLIVQGQQNQAIANSLNISLPTAKAHVRNILLKLGAGHRTQAAVEALRRGLV